MGQRIRLFSRSVFVVSDEKRAARLRIGARDCLSSAQRVHEAASPIYFTLPRYIAKSLGSWHHSLIMRAKSCSELCMPCILLLVAVREICFIFFFGATAPESSFCVMPHPFRHGPLPTKLCPNFLPLQGASTFVSYRTVRNKKPLPEGGGTRSFLLGEGGTFFALTTVTRVARAGPRWKFSGEFHDSFRSQINKPHDFTTVRTSVFIH